MNFLGIARAENKQRAIVQSDAATAVTGAMMQQVELLDAEALRR
jgi:hypothetical protein